MKKRKILSWVLSLALVFSMTSAFVVTVNADQGETNEIQSLEKNLQLDGAYEPTTVSSVKVNGVTLHSGDYITNSSQTQPIGNSTTAPEGSGYAYFNGGHLVLNGFNLNYKGTDDSIDDCSLDDNAISARSSNTNTQTLYIDIIGKNNITVDSAANSPIFGEAVDSDDDGNPDCGGVFFVFSEKAENSSLNIQQADYSCYAIVADSIKINSGTYNFKSDQYGICADEDIIINGGIITFKAVGECAINADNSIFVNGGKIHISDMNSIGGADAFVIGIMAAGDVNINGGEITINDLYTYESSESDGWSQACGIIGNNIIINNAKITMSGITAIGSGSGYAAGIYGADVSINNSTLDIKTNQYAINSSSIVKINNSNVTAQSTSDSPDYPAIYQSVSLSGNPTVYAGADTYNKELITSNDGLRNYKYVEIINEQTVSSNFISSIFSNITKLFTSTSKFNLGSMLSYLLIGKLLIKIIKIL